MNNKDMKNEIKYKVKVWTEHVNSVGHCWKTKFINHG